MRLRSIEQKIFLLILPICLIPPVILLLLPGLGLRPAFERSIGSELSSRAEYLAGMFDGYLGGRLERLRALALAPPPDPVKLAAAAGECGAAGVVIVHHGPPTPPVIVLNDPADKYARWLAEARFFKPEIQQGLTLPPTGLIQDLALSMPARLMPLPLLMFALETPAHERLFFLFEAAELVDAFRRSLPKHPESFNVYSSSGYVTYSYESTDSLLVARLAEEMNVARKDSRWFVLTSGRAHYLIAPAASQLMKSARMTTSQGAIWTMLLTEDMDNFLGPLDGFTWLAVVIALLLTLVILPLGILAARRIVGPLIHLKRQAEKLAQGDLDVRAAVTTRDEVGELSETFNTMAVHLRTTYRALEDRLAENQLRASHINVINEITGAIVQVLSLDRIFEVLVRETGKLVAFDAMWIALLEPGAAELAITQIHPAGLVSLFDRGRIPLAGALHGHVVEHRETLHAEIGHYDRGDFFETRIFRAQGFQSYLIAPLPARNRIIGTLTIASTTPDAFSPRLAPIMTSLAGAVAIAIEQTSLFQRISRLAADLEHKVDDRTRELEQANRKLIQTEKYFATGRMAANVAHEINNPLGIIKNYLRLVEKGLGPGAADGRGAEINPTHIRIINEEVDRIAGLVHQMLNLQRPEEKVVKPVDVNGLIEELLYLMEQDLLRQGIQVRRELAAGLPQPLGSPDLIRQVLINLIRNAQDAMDGGGTLTLRTSVLAQWSGGSEEQVLHIRVADTGCGIAPELLPEIFDPFFTTKPPDKGTGLGLCVSYSIVSMYRGTIDVESTPGAGTTVVVTLPVELPEDALPEPPAGRTVED